MKLKIKLCSFLDNDFIIINIDRGISQKRTFQLNLIIKIKIYSILYKMASAWIEHVKAYAKKNKISYKEAMSKAKPSYKKKDTSKTKDKKPTKAEMKK